MKRIVTLLLAAALLLGLASCASGVTAENIKLENARYTVRAAGERGLAEEQGYGGTSDAALVDDGFLAVITAAMEQVKAAAYVVDFTGTRGEFEDVTLAEEYAESFFEKRDETVILASELKANGIWAASSEGELVDDVKSLWVNRYENLDGDMEYVVDVSRNAKPLRTLRFIFNEGDAAPALTSNTLAANYDGREPSASPKAAPAESGLASDMYFSGSLYKTGIFEQPVLGGVDFMFSVAGKPVEGELEGGFAGMFEGTVTIDGMTTSFTANANDIPVPLGLVEDPSQWYLGVSRVTVNNPQDTTGYRHIYLIKSDYTEIIGLYMTYRTAEFSEWFSVGRVSKADFTAAVADNNARLTSLYAAVMTEAHGSRKEYNNTLAVLYNMFTGVEQSYLEKNLPAAISRISSDIRDYSDCYMDESIARLGENDFWFFPDGRSTVARLFEYDGDSAIVAIDFSTKQDDGYGGLYRAAYSGGEWTLETIVPNRIK